MLSKPQRLFYNEIRAKAEEFRKNYVKPTDKIPLPIEEIIEFELDIAPWPKKGLRQKIDIDGFLSNDLKNIFVDYDIYWDERWSNRLRFTYAHEIGHLVLHKNEIQKCEFRTEKNWIKFRTEMSEDDLFWYEQQAYEFAGRLLVPKKKLIEELNQKRDQIEHYKSLVANDDDEILIQAISRVICDKFGVSNEVIIRRIQIEKIWKDMNF